MKNTSNRKIFVSSTYTDLQYERQAVFSIINEFGSVPSGFEYIQPALNIENQGLVTKRLIEECSCLILIVGSRYGSANHNGVSYVELEYEYALKMNIPIFTYVLSENKFNIDKTLKNEYFINDNINKNRRLSFFKRKLGNRLVKTWQNSSELTTMIRMDLSTWLARESVDLYNPIDSQIWTPNNKIVPVWVDNSPSYLSLAKDIIKNGKMLSDMHWRDFEKLMGDLLEKDGWNVVVTQPTKDGGVDIIADRKIEGIGNIKSVWQAKKYSASNTVKLNEVRELYAIREDFKASKALIVTTNRLTKDAIDWIKKDEFRFGYKDGKDIEAWIERVF